MGFSISSLPNSFPNQLVHSAPKRKVQVIASCCCAFGSPRPNPSCVAAAIEAQAGKVLRKSSAKVCSRQGLTSSSGDSGATLAGPDCVVASVGLVARAGW